ncbi:polysaccharide biosynthesis/export family protein [Novosphingobium sp. PC22D]|uniref:polysaccharide biosynthesis/export family protein n=1 Tax=Novosphingobium sp. PC22D TaxID=1962403 RepID=UPI001F0B089E|nr:polysaccharide biosynthesis/export family protein [Novosphingobium sp. PC22D]
MRQQEPLENGERCFANATRLPELPHADLAASSAMLLGPGDRLRLRVIGDSDKLTGTYVVAIDGRIMFPGAGSVTVAGGTAERAESEITRLLVSRGLVRPLRRVASLSLVESAGVSVAVSGAVFQPGQVRAGERSREDRIGQSEGEASGDANVGRSVSAALRAAGGVRPDADISRIGLVRGGRLMVLDLRPGHDGTAAGNIMLASGDRIVVPSSGCFDASLMRPSPVTTPGIRVFMSNLSRPANNNAGAAVGKDATSLPYGTRMLQGLVAMNCVGGSAMNARRRAVLISRNPMNGRSVVIEREVEDLVRHADRDDRDPYLMPGDALACYDSRMMNFADAVGLVSSAASAVTPALLVEEAIGQ